MPAKLNSEDIVGSFFTSSCGTDCVVTNYKNSKNADDEEKSLENFMTSFTSFH